MMAPTLTPKPAQGVEATENAPIAAAEARAPAPARVSAVECVTHARLLTVRTEALLVEVAALLSSAQISVVVDERCRGFGYRYRRRNPARQASGAGSGRHLRGCASGARGVGHCLAGADDRGRVKKARAQGALGCLSGPVCGKRPTERVAMSIMPSCLHAFMPSCLHAKP